MSDNKAISIFFICAAVICCIYLAFDKTSVCQDLINQRYRQINENKSTEKTDSLLIKLNCGCNEKN